MADPEVAASIAREERAAAGQRGVDRVGEFRQRSRCWRPSAAYSPTSTRRAIPASDITAAASSSTRSSGWPSTAPSSCLAPSTPTCSLIPAPTPTWPPTCHSSSRAIGSSGSASRKVDTLHTGTRSTSPAACSSPISSGSTSTTGLIDYDVVAGPGEGSAAESASSPEPAPTVARWTTRGSAPIADEVGAFLFADIAHPAGLIASGLHPSPIPYAHVTMTTTHKTLRGPRGGMLLYLGGVRQDDRQDRLSRHAGRAADARHRWQGGRLRRSALPGDSRTIPGASSTTPGRWRRRSLTAGCRSSPAAQTRT